MTEQFIASISEIDAAQWNRLVSDDHPLLSHQFLLALEQSGSVSEATGWRPCHYVSYGDVSYDDVSQGMALDKPGRLVAAAPLYVKTHSYGEYVFDWVWADAYHRNGLEYYPKLVNAIPFTPCEGARFLHAYGAKEAGQALNKFQDRCVEYSRTLGASSIHRLFPDECELEIFNNNRGPDWLLRQGVQYHWYNRGYKSFTDFLAALTSRRRKTIKKERAKVEQANLKVVRWSGTDLSLGYLSRYYHLYCATYLKRGQRPYLSEAFFQQLLASMAESMMFVFVFREDAEPLPENAVAGALFFQGTRTLYGRYWGCLEEYDSLHFEVCYYQGIEYCIEKGLQHFDAGAQGEHKLIRGFEPIMTRSFHYIDDERFRDAIAQHLTQERQHIQAHYVDAQSALPYKQAEDSA